MIMALTGFTAILNRLRLTTHRQKCHPKMTFEHKRPRRMYGELQQQQIGSRPSHNGLPNSYIRIENQLYGHTHGYLATVMILSNAL